MQDWNVDGNLSIVKKEKPCASWFWPGVMMKLKKLKPIPNSLKKCEKFMERTIALSAQVK